MPRRNQHPVIIIVLEIVDKKKISSETTETTAIMDAKWKIGVEVQKYRN